MSDTAAERYPMMEGWRESGRGGGGGDESGSIGLVGWRFIYNAERPEERVYLCGQDLRRGLQFVSVCVCVCVHACQNNCVHTVSVNTRELVQTGVFTNCAHVCVCVCVCVCVRVKFRQVTART